MTDQQRTPGRGRRARTWKIAAGAGAVTIVLGAAGVASGCLPLASACPGPTVQVRPEGQASYGSGPDLTSATAGEPITVAGYGFGFCDDTGGELCSRDGRVSGPRDVTVTWQVPGHEPSTVGTGKIDGAASFRIDVVLPEQDAGQSGLLVVRRGDVGDRYEPYSFPLLVEQA
ncbi:hypothetical protein [Cellulomonas palmilytica]|uniref:hypothetical protein n=1 Tax=Cellulomonas palmilytica TaxID=2608402 RepID=UPI001F41FF0C|nr:hypothetical protein [Cellulomonas palmilytica]UJP38949.1 hypothetical protein F1D97_11250 [Cellulomonas palmilytica]